MRRDIYGIAAQDVEWHKVQHPLMGCGEHHRRGNAVAVGEQPVAGRNAPTVAGLQAGEPELRCGRRQVITDTALMVEELNRDNRTDGVTPPILNTGATGAVPKPSRERVVAAKLEFAADNVAFHAVSIAATNGRCAV